MRGRSPVRAAISRYQLFPAPLLSLLSPRNGVFIQGRKAFIMAASAAGFCDCFTYHAAIGADEIAALQGPLIVVRPAGFAEVMGACIPPELGVDAGCTACIVAQYAGQGRCCCNWYELHLDAAARRQVGVWWDFSEVASGVNSCRCPLHPADAIVRPVDELCWDVSRIKATAASAAALGRRCFTHWWGVIYSARP